MSKDGYQGGTTPGSRWGCAAVTLFGFPIFFFLLIGDALGDCIPGEPCHKGFLAYVVLPTAIVALVAGLGVRAIVNRSKRNGS